MSLERAGHYVVEFLGDDEASERADLAFLQSVADSAAARGYDVTTDELRDAFRSMASLDDAEVAGFGGLGGFGGVTATAFITATNTASNSAFNTAFNTADAGRYGNWSRGWSPLGFMNR